MANKEKEKRAFLAGFSLGHDRNADISRAGALWRIYSGEYEKYCSICKETLTAQNKTEVIRGEHDEFIFSHKDVPHKMLKIIKCNDGMRWYAGLVGERVPFLGDSGNEYISTDQGGLTNFVQHGDCEIVEAN